MKDNFQKIIETAKQLKEISELCQFLSKKLICQHIKCDYCVLNKQMENLTEELNALLLEAEAIIYLLKRRER